MSLCNVDKYIRIHVNKEYENFLRRFLLLFACKKKSEDIYKIASRNVPPTNKFTYFTTYEKEIICPSLYFSNNN